MSKTPYDPEFIETVKQEYLGSGASLAAIAKQFGIGQRTVEGWASEGGWSALRKSSNVVPIGKKSKPKAHPTPQITGEEFRPIAQRRHRQPSQIDEMEIVATAIFDISSAMATASSEDLRSLGGLATGLCRLIELRLKLQPRTAAELAEQIIALGIPPTELVAELKQKWQVRA